MYKVKMDEYEMDANDDTDREMEVRESSDYSNINLADSQAREGKDIQGIPWETLSITREKYRQTRLEQYKNYENIPNSSECSKKDCSITQTGASYYDFRQSSRSVKTTILHFQLRNLVWATSKHDVYFMSHNSVVHWSSLTSNKSQVLNFSGPIDERSGSLLNGFTNTQVSTLAVKDNLLVVGGFRGELIWKDLYQHGVASCFQTTGDNAITNSIEIYVNPSGAIHFTASNNDCGVRDFDAEKCQLSNEFSFPWPVNHSSLSPDGKLQVIVGDSLDGLLVDSNTGKTVMALLGHSDYSFASAWHPDGITFATGNQDKTCRIWDTRNLSKSVAVLSGKLGAIRSIRYTADGQYMAMSEAADFVHIYDARNGYEREQEIDFFGDTSGISFSPDTESLFIGVWDRSYSCLVKYSRHHSNMVCAGTTDNSVV